MIKRDELGNDPMKLGVFVPKPFLTGTQGTEIFRGFRNDIGEQLEYNPSCRLSTDSDIKETLGTRHCCLVFSLQKEMAMVAPKFVLCSFHMQRIFIPNNNTLTLQGFILFSHREKSTNLLMKYQVGRCMEEASVHREQR